MCETIIIAFKLNAFEQLSVPIVLNGDLFTPSDAQRMNKRYPASSAVMIGRGVIGNPALALKMKGGSQLTRQQAIDFHDALVDAYLATGNSILALVRMRMVTYYMVSCFENPHKPWKIIRKARTLDEYLAGVKVLFEQHDFLSEPYYQVLAD